jgi:hypothetical protein
MLNCKGLATVSELTDIDIAEAKLSKKLAREADDNTAPLHALLDFWRALRWLLPGWPMAKMDKLAKLGDESTRVALKELLRVDHDLATTLHLGPVNDSGAGVSEANTLIARVRELSEREAFFHWWTAFPNVWKPNGEGGFDAVIGNPPWDRIKLQEVEWFAERSPHIAAQARAADRKAMIAELHKKKAPLAKDYAEAVERAEANTRVLGNGKQGSGDYPLLGNGDINLYSLFVERAQALLNPQGIVGLLTPSGIAADKGAAEFFKSISTTGRLGALYDFENKKVFFADVHASFKFCVLVFGAMERRFAQSRCAFYLHSTDEASDPSRVLALSAEDFTAVNPNTGSAPIFRNRRDAEITLKLYREHPVLVRHGELSKSLGQQADTRTWPVKYMRMFDMTNDSHLFLKREELVKQGYKPAALNHWVNAQGEEAVPLYEGKMVQMYDHRAADVVVNAENLHRAAQQESIPAHAKASPDRYPTPQYWVKDSDTAGLQKLDYCLAFKDVTAPTNMRTMIAALIPKAGFGNTLPMLLPAADEASLTLYKQSVPLLLANLASFAFDFAARQKVQGQHLNWFVVEQLPVITPERFEQSIGGVKIADFIREQVLHLSYTAHDLAPFARDLGYVNADGSVKPPFVWNEEERRTRMAALDALFFQLYGISEDDAAYIMDTFPIVREQDMKAYGHYRTKEEVLKRLSAMARGELRLL